VFSAQSQFLEVPRRLFVESLKKVKRKDKLKEFCLFALHTNSVAQQNSN
jgi:hypothetical protein